MPTLQPLLPYDMTTFGVVLFILCGICFFLTGCVNPGVPPMPKVPLDAGRSAAAEKAGSAAWLIGAQLPHPGEQYSLSRDTNRCAAARSPPRASPCCRRLRGLARPAPAPRGTADAIARD